MGPRSRAVVLLVGVIGLAIGLAAPAGAAPVEREKYSFVDDPFRDTICGRTWTVQSQGSGVFMLKAPRADGAPPYFFDNYNTVTTFTASNGDSFLITSKGLYKDLKITLVEGTTYRFVSHESGQAFVVRTADGKAVHRDKGLLVNTFVVDTKGDTDLDNDVFVEGSFENLADHGGHPGFFWEEEQFCEVIARALAG